MTLEDKSVPDFSVDIIPTLENSIGIDVGLEKFLCASDQSIVPIPQHFRHLESKLASLQQEREKQQKGTRARNRFNKKIAKLHQKVARQRRNFHLKTAHQLLSKADVIFVEDLTVANLVKRCKPKIDDQGNYLPNNQSGKSGLNKSIHDAGWSQFVSILSFKAERAGKIVVKVDPKGTSQYCSTCLNKVSKDLSERWHSCPNCRCELDRDINSSILIKIVGLGGASLKNGRTFEGRQTEAHAVP